MKTTSFLTFCILLFTFLLFPANSAFAQDSNPVAMDSNDLFYNIVNFRRHRVEVTYPDDTPSRPWQGHPRPSGSIIFPDSITHHGSRYQVRDIAAWTFMGCDSITDIQLPPNLKVIGFSAFAFCTRLTSVHIPATVSYIGSCSFMGCSNLQSVSLPNILKELKPYLFADCSNLTDITLPSSLEVISRSAFDRTGLSSVILPASIKFIDYNAFRDCSSLIRIQSLATRPPVVAPGAFSGISTQAVLYVPKDSKEAYLSDPDWNHFSSIIEISE